MPGFAWFPFSSSCWTVHCSDFEYVALHACIHWPYHILCFIPCAERTTRSALFEINSETGWLASLSVPDLPKKLLTLISLMKVIHSLKDCLRTSFDHFIFGMYFQVTLWCLGDRGYCLRHLVKPGILAIKGAVGKTFGRRPSFSSAPIQKTSCHPGVFQTVFCGWEFTSSTGRSLRMAKPS